MSCQPCWPYYPQYPTVTFRQATAAHWVVSNPVLKSGEPGYESDTGSWKLGDGVTAWADLPYQDAAGPAGPAGPPGEPGQDGVMGPAAPPYSLVIGSITSGPVPSATITGTAPNQVLNLVLPVGGGGGGGGGADTLAFVSNPADATVYAGDSVTFSANAQSTQTPIAYKWQASNDQTNWTDAGTGQTLTLTAALADNGKQYRCVATTSTLGPVYSLVADLTVNANVLGQTWRLAASNAPWRISYINNRFAGIGGATSVNGDSWLAGAVKFDSAPAFGNGTWVGLKAVSNGTSVRATPFTSPDAINWTAQSQIPATVNTGGSSLGTPSNAYSAPGVQPVSFLNGKFFVFLGTPANRTPKNVVVYHSSDGDRWTLGSVAGLAFTDAWAGATGLAELCEVRGIANSTSLSVAVGRGLKGNLTTAPVLTNKCIRSVDQANWAASTMPFSASWNDVAYGGGLFIAVADGAYAAASTDGINWMAIRMPSTLNWTSIEYFNGLWVAAGGPSAVVATTRDVNNWTLVDVGESATWSGLAYGAGRFLLTSTTGKSMYSGA